MPKRGVLHFSPDPIEDTISNLNKFTSDSEAIRNSETEYQRMFASMGGVAYFDRDGIFQSYHVTDNPFIMENALVEGKDLVEGRSIGSRMCPGFAVTQQIDRYIFHSRSRWVVIDSLKPEQIGQIINALRTELTKQVTTGYISQIEYGYAVDSLFRWMDRGDTDGPYLIGGQPYNIDVPGLIKALGISDIGQPSVLQVNFEGRYLDMSGREAQEEAYYLASLVLGESPGKLAIEDVCSVLRKAGWDGVFNRASMGMRAELIIWNVDKIISFGNWKRDKKSSLSGAYRSRPQRLKLEFVYECPARGRIEFSIWPRKGEMQADTGARGLREIARLDEPQIPYCRKVYAKYIE